MSIRIAQQASVNTDGQILNPPLIEPQKCNLFGSFSFIVQLILGVLSFMVLVFKRFKENPRRPWKVWFFDVSKQIMSACTIHMMNLFIAIFLSSNNEGTAKSDECMWYFINLLIDTTLGVFICFSLMLLVEKLAKDLNIKELQSGLYYEKVKKKGKMVIQLKPKMYFIQLGIWVLIVVVSKLALLAFTKLFSYYLEAIGKFILKPFAADDKFELIMVMVIFPLIFNAIQFWVLDNVLKLPAEEIKNIIDVPEEENDNNEQNDKTTNLPREVELNDKSERSDDQISEKNQNKSEYIPPQEIENKESHILVKDFINEKLKSPQVSEDNGISNHAIEKKTIDNISKHSI